MTSGIDFDSIGTPSPKASASPQGVDFDTLATPTPHPLGAGHGVQFDSLASHGHYDFEGLKHLWVSAGGDPKQADIMAHAAMAESGDGKTYADPNSNHDHHTSYVENGVTYYPEGLWQISTISGFKDSFDPMANAKHAVQLFKERGMEPWDMSKHGGAGGGWGQYVGEHFDPNESKLKKAPWPKALPPGGFPAVLGVTPTIPMTEKLYRGFLMSVADAAEEKIKWLQDATWSTTQRVKMDVMMGATNFGQDPHAADIAAAGIPGVLYGIPGVHPTRRVSQAVQSRLSPVLRRGFEAGDYLPAVGNAYLRGLAYNDWTAYHKVTGIPDNPADLGDFLDKVVGPLMINAPQDVDYYKDKPGLLNYWHEAQTHTNAGTMAALAIGMHSDLARLKPSHPYFTGAETMGLEQANLEWLGLGKLGQVGTHTFFEELQAARMGKYGNTPIIFGKGYQDIARMFADAPGIGNRFWRMGDSGGIESENYHAFAERNHSAVWPEALGTFTSYDTFGGLDREQQIILGHVIEHPAYDNFGTPILRDQRVEAWAKQKVHGITYQERADNYMKRIIQTESDLRAVSPEMAALFIDGNYLSHNGAWKMALDEGPIAQPRPGIRPPINGHRMVPTLLEGLDKGMVLNDDWMPSAAAVLHEGVMRDYITWMNSARGLANVLTKEPWMLEPRYHLAETEDYGGTRVRVSAHNKAGEQESYIDYDIRRGGEVHVGYVHTEGQYGRGSNVGKARLSAAMMHAFRESVLKRVPNVERITAEYLNPHMMQMSHEIFGNTWDPHYDEPLDFTIPRSLDSNGMFRDLVPAYHYFNADTPVYRTAQRMYDSVFSGRAKGFTPHLFPIEYQLPVDTAGFQRAAEEAEAEHYANVHYSGGYRNIDNYDDFMKMVERQARYIARDKSWNAGAHPDNDPKMPSYVAAARDQLIAQARTVFNKSHPNHVFDAADFLGSKDLRGLAISKTGIDMLIDVSSQLRKAYRGKAQDFETWLRENPEDARKYLENPTARDSMEDTHLEPPEATHPGYRWLEFFNGAIRQGQVLGVGYHGLFNLAPNALTRLPVKWWGWIATAIGANRFNDIPEEWLEALDASGAVQKGVGGVGGIPTKELARIITVPMKNMTKPRLGSEYDELLGKPPPEEGATEPDWAARAEKAYVMGSQWSQRIAFEYQERRIAAVVYHYLTHAEKMKPAQAAREVSKLLNDSHNLTRGLEQDHIRHWAYFYGWVRRGLHLAARTALEQPRKIVGPLRGVQTANDLQGDQGSIAGTALSMRGFGKSVERLRSADEALTGRMFGQGVVNAGKAVSDPLERMFGIKNLGTDDHGNPRYVDIPSFWSFGSTMARALGGDWTAVAQRFLGTATPAAGIPVRAAITQFAPGTDIPEGYNYVLWDRDAPSTATKFLQFAKSVADQYGPITFRSGTGGMGPTTFTEANQSKITKAQHGALDDMRKTLYYANRAGDQDLAFEIYRQMGLINSGDANALMQSRGNIARWNGMLGIKTYQRRNRYTPRF